MVRMSWITLVLLLIWASGSATAETTQWRSALYPEDWQPCNVDNQGRFLQDFSFAGYRSGLVPLPDEMLAPVIDVTQAPYYADPTGQQDATAAIQAAIDAVGQAGGGTVYLPAGTYSLRVAENRKAALHITHNNVRLIGAGTDRTFLRLDNTQVRGKNMILVEGSGSWTQPVSTAQAIRENLTYPTQVIPLAGTPAFAVGDWVILTHDTTATWISEHRMADLWRPGDIPGATFYRQVIAVDEVANTITVDAPIRYYLLPRDNARVYRVGPHVEEVGLAHFSLGMVEHKGSGWGGVDYNKPGTAAYDVHGSHAIKFRHAVNSWVLDVKSFKPAGNARAHILSNGILIDRSRFVTVDTVELHEPQYRGEGGNGYHFTISANDSLITNSTAINGRHNYDFKQAVASGNVITSSRAYAPDGLTSDFHMHLSPSNLIDNMTMDQDRFDAGWRGTSGTTPHGLTTTHTVIWNTTGERYQARARGSIVYTDQYGWGYVIGTQGPAAQVNIGRQERTAPVDYVEGVGKGATLVPQSLYYDQLARRKEHQQLISCPLQDFRVVPVEVAVTSPAAEADVRGLVPVQVSVSLPERAKLQRFTVLLNDRELYRGAGVPTSLQIDGDALPDGTHTLTAIADTSLGQATHTTTFRVDNWWEWTDALQPPIQSGWFGMLTLMKTSAQSKGWVHLTDNKELYWGDGDRLARKDDTSEYLIWETPQLVEVQVTVYVRDPAAAKSVSLAASPDGRSWYPLFYKVTAEEQGAAGWHKLVLTASEPKAAAGWLNLTIPKGAPVADLQLGEVKVRGRN